MSDTDTSPRVTRFNLAGRSSFIPLQDEQAALLATKRLSTITPSKSYTNIFSLPRRARGVSVSDDEAEPNLNLTMSNDYAGRRPTLKHATTVFERERDRSPYDLNEERRMSHAAEVLMTPQMRSMRLIGNSNPRYQWQRYYKTPEQLKEYNKPLRKYYERVNFLIAHYLYIDRLLDSSLVHNLISEYQEPELQTIQEEVASPAINGTPPSEPSRQHSESDLQGINSLPKKLKRTPKNLYKISDEASPLLQTEQVDIESAAEDLIDVPYEEEEDADAGSTVVKVAIYINLVANIILLLSKIAVIVLTDSLSVLASLVDAALDFLSTAIVWITTYLIQRQDQYSYPVGRRRLEPVGVLVFSVIMITSFFQVGLQCLNRLTSDDRAIVELSLPAIIIMLSTVVIKGFCYFWCRLVKNSSVQALAQDALTDIVFNTFSIIFPLIGFYAKIWWLDALGGLLLSMYVISNWSRSASEHIRNLSGAAATADERNILLYLTMRFAKTIKYIQGLQAYHAGDKLNVEVDIVLEESMSLRDSHDLGESLQYVLESVPTVDRAFVHADYKRENLPSHMNQQA